MNQEITESLLETIQQSHITVVIFSQNHTHSEYCLNELLKIAECRERDGQIVIPVFYRVDPSHVQDLTGNYEMAQLRTKFNESLVEKWGNVLKETANLSGLVSSSFSTESQLIEEIIKQVFEILNRLYPSDSARDGGLVGIDSRVEKVMSLLYGPEDVRVVGIWGEPGVGKTTVAKATFDRIRSQFDHQCFVGDVREKCEKFTAAATQNEVLSRCFGISDSGMSRKKLSRKKVILVLDDVSDLSQVKSIIRYKVDMGCGSRIIVMSRDMRLLKKLDAKIYEVEKLHRHEALRLFSLHAFDKRVPEDGYLELSERAVKYAGGLPLALETLGWNLFQRSVEEWEYELEKFRCLSDKKMYKISRISYDGLWDLEKEIMKDIASCLRGRKGDEAENLMIEVYIMWRGSTLLANLGVKHQKAPLIPTLHGRRQPSADRNCPQTPAEISSVMELGGPFCPAKT